MTGLVLPSTLTNRFEWASTLFIRPKPTAQLWSRFQNFGFRGKLQSSAQHISRILIDIDANLRFPKWREQKDWKTTHLASYIENSLEIGSPAWCTLIEGIASAGIWVALAFSERAEGHIYMSQSLISPEGKIVMHRRKLRPSGSERDMFSDGTTDQLRVKNTPLGRVGMLQCGE